MLYIDAETLVVESANADILQWADAEHCHIAIYHKEGDAYHPEGWYADSLEEVVQSVKENKHVQNILLSKLHQKGIHPKQFDIKSWNRNCGIFGVLEEEGEIE